MFEITVTVLIAAGSALLLGYWFRYTCLLIVTAKTALDYARDVATANRLSFLDVQSCLSQSQSNDLSGLHRALERDYTLLSSLLKSAQSMESSSIETRMLAAHFRMMSVWYRVSRNFSNGAAQQALEEMSLVVAHFANIMGERTACSSAA